MPGSGDGAGIFVVLERENGVDADEEAIGAREIELLRIEPADGGDHLDAKLGGVEQIAIGEGEVDGGKGLAVVGEVVGVFGDGDGRGGEGDAGDVAGGESGGERVGVEEGCGDVLKGRGGAATDGDVGELKELDAGVEGGGGDAAQVGAGVDPGEAGLVVVLRALPVLERDDGELRVEGDLDVG